MHIAVIGAGAAGCFAAIGIKRRLPEADVTIYEGGKRQLAKVSVTGGGRCNLTNSFNQVKSLAHIYPRGERLMKRLLKGFSCCIYMSRTNCCITKAHDYQCLFEVFLRITKRCTNIVQPNLETLRQVAAILDVDIRDLLCPTK